MRRITRIRINGQVAWNCFVGSGGHWVGVCDPLKITLQSDTWGDLMEDMATTIDALLKELFTTRDFDRFMQDRGWTFVGPVPNRIDVDKVRFDVPFIPQVVNAHGAANYIPQ